MATKRLKSSLSSVSSSICHQCRAAPVNTGFYAHTSRRALSTEAARATPAEGLVTSHIGPEAPSPTRPPHPPPITPRDRAGHPANPFLRDAEVTLYSFPGYAPVKTTTYPGSYLLLPLRRDILHRAVVYEGDKTRQGTAHTLTRHEVHGSNRKVRPQKGTGMARLGDKKNPMLRGGGVAFGPKPRSFATDLPKKIYDLAWRTALSYRFRRGELVVLDGEAEIEREGAGASRWVRELLQWNCWGKADGGSLIVTAQKRSNLWDAMGREDKDVATQMKPHGRCLDVTEVDVKDLLELGRVIVERKALDKIFQQHRSDMLSDVKVLPHLQ